MAQDGPLARFPGPPGGTGRKNIAEDGGKEPGTVVVACLAGLKWALPESAGESC